MNEYLSIQDFQLILLRLELSLRLLLHFQQFFEFAADIQCKLFEVFREFLVHNIQLKYQIHFEEYFDLFEREKWR